jgi:hypothetical protein
VQRGVYFDAWFPRQHCYHPSLPPRRLRMVDDLVDYRATVLVWAALGGGSLSLPYLEQEAFGDVGARERFYGFVNDAEFIAECHKRGIKVFGIVFEAQGWEFPVELDDDESRVLALNELRGAGRRGWLGLREFSQNRYPKLWPPMETYFPGGLRNSDGELVTDLIEECGVRDIYGQLCHAHWVECPDREHQCYYMDRNNPVWREYLKAIIRIQIDAGVDGIQLDEAELPLGAMQYGACFCKDCMKGFRDYLAQQPEVDRDPALADVDLDTFHYGTWLLERGYDFKTDLHSTPLFGDYYRFQCAAITTYFAELADYARSYGRQRGRDILVSGNFFNVDPHYLPLAEKCDLIITEMRNTTDRQPEWYRHVAGFARGKDVVVVENPYGGVVPELVEQLKVGRGFDRFRLSLVEGAAFGAPMSVPYGAWMGSRIEDAFYAPHEVATRVQAFLADHEHLFSSRTWNQVAVVYSVESNRELVARADQSDNVRNATDPSVEVPYRVVTKGLARSAVPFDVVLFPDGVTADDPIQVEILAPYATVILPMCTHLTPRQAEALQRYLESGGHVVAVGDLGANLPERKRRALRDHPQVTHADAHDVDGLLPLGRQVRVAGTMPRRGSLDVSVNIHRLNDDAAAVHLVSYAYDADLDAVEQARDVDLTVSLPFTARRATVVGLDQPPVEVSVRAEPVTANTDHGSVHTLRLDKLGLYTIVVLDAPKESRG